jgi:hypothetical protein
MCDLFRFVCGSYWDKFADLYRDCSHGRRQIVLVREEQDRLCDLVVRVLGYRSGGPGSRPGTTKKKVVGLERGPLSLVSTTEELLDRKVATLF